MRRFNLLRGILISLVIISFYACKSDPVSPDPNSTYKPPVSAEGITVLESQYLDTTSLNKVIDRFESSPNYYLANLGNHVENLANNSGANIIWYAKITYASTDNKGAPINLSAKLIYPYKPFTTFKVPLISFQHATELMKEHAPSQWQAYKNPGDFTEVEIAAGIALKNQWAIIMPDYQGMGEDRTEPHPLCHADRLAKSAADLITYTIAYLKSKDNNTNLEWNGKLFIMGFSEGGYSTAATVREIEKRGGINITGAVCLDAPFDLTGTMLQVMLSDAPFGAPFFLPYLLRGYNGVYEDSKVFNFDSLLLPQYAKDLFTYSDGLHTAHDLNAKMPADKIIKKIFKQSAIDSLTNPNSRMRMFLHENNIWYGWKPKTKMFIAHAMNDDLVPYGNFVKLKQEWGALPNVEYFELGQCINYLGSVHGSVAPWAFLQGTLWISEQAE